VQKVEKLIEESSKLKGKNKPKLSENEKHVDVENTLGIIKS